MTQGTDIFLRNVPSSCTITAITAKLEDIAGPGCVRSHIQHRSNKSTEGGTQYHHYQITIDTPEHAKEILYSERISFGAISIPILEYKSLNEIRKPPMTTSVNIIPVTPLSLQTILHDNTLNPFITKISLATNDRPFTLQFYRNQGIDDFLRFYAGRQVADTFPQVSRRDDPVYAGTELHEMYPHKTLFVAGFPSTTNAIQLFKHFMGYNVTCVSLRKNTEKGTATAFITLEKEAFVFHAAQDPNLQCFMSPTPNLTITQFIPKDRSGQSNFARQQMNGAYPMMPYQNPPPPGYGMPMYDQNGMMPYGDPNVMMPSYMNGYGNMMPQAQPQMMNQGGYPNQQMAYQNMPPQQMSQMGPMMPMQMNQYPPQQIPQPMPQMPYQMSQMNMSQPPPQHMSQQPMMMPQMPPQQQQISPTQQMYQQQPPQQRPYPNSLDMQQGYQQYSNQPLPQNMSHQSRNTLRIEPFNLNELSGTEDDRRQQIGNYIYSCVESPYGEDMASKITGLILMLEFPHLLQVVSQPELLQQKIDEGYQLLKDKH